MLKDAEYILLRKSITKEIVRHKKELERNHKEDLQNIRDAYDCRLRKMQEKYDSCYKHLINQRDNENKFIEEIERLKRILRGLSSLA